jgi:hypothetical protein
MNSKKKVIEFLLFTQLQKVLFMKKIKKMFFLILIKKKINNLTLHIKKLKKDILYFFLTNRPDNKILFKKENVNQLLTNMPFKI